MRITIDTKHDSKEEIRKAIELLRSVLDQTSSSPDMFSNSGGYQDIFGNTPQPQPQQQPSGGLFDMFSTPTQDSSSSYPQPASSPTFEKPRKPRPSVMGFELYE